MSEYKKAAECVPRTGVILILLGALTVLGGCSPSGRVYMTTLRNYPACVTESGISQAKVDACMDNTDKADFNSCLVDKKVPQPRIDRLNACVEAHRRTTIGNLF